jgi:y4mF family transcriptional regulator
MRKELNLSQNELAMRVGVGLRFIRDVEQGKETIRLDKLNQVLRYFGLEVGAVKMRREDE